MHRPNDLWQLASQLSLTRHTCSARPITSVNNFPFINHPVFVLAQSVWETDHAVWISADVGDPALLESCLKRVRFIAMSASSKRLTGSQLGSICYCLHGCYIHRSSTRKQRAMAWINKSLVCSAGISLNSLQVKVPQANTTSRVAALPSDS